MECTCVWLFLRSCCVFWRFHLQASNISPQSLEDFKYSNESAEFNSFKRTVIHRIEFLFVLRLCKHSRWSQLSSTLKKTLPLVWPKFMLLRTFTRYFWCIFRASTSVPNTWFCRLSVRRLASIFYCCLRALQGQKSWSRTTSTATETRLWKYLFLKTIFRPAMMIS